jgi:hypothetical protein
MPEAVTEQMIVDALRQVPPERWDEVLRFLDILKGAGPPIRTAADLLNSELVGLWADRTDIGDSREFARRLRESGEHRCH